MGDPHGLVSMVFSAPQAALAGAQSLLDSGPTPYDASLAHQAIGIVHRERGNYSEAVSHLRRARGLARRAGSAQREADVCATLGVALVQAGRARQGLAELTHAIELSRGDVRAKVRFRLAGVLRILGRHDEAMIQVAKALPPLRKAGDTLWTARALTLRALLHLTAGATGRAEADFAQAEQMFSTIDHRHDSAVARQNRAAVAFAAGDQPTVLAHLSIADERIRALGAPTYSLMLARCEVLLAANLADDAVREADAALGELPRGQATKRAELLLLAARAALAAGDPVKSAGYARAARRMFTRQHRDWWSHHAHLQEITALWTAGQVSKTLAAQANRIALALSATGSADVPQAHLLAARLTLALAHQATPFARRDLAAEHEASAAGAGREGIALWREAEGHLLAAARHRHRGPVEARVAAWVASALRAQAAGDLRGLRHSCRGGLRVLDDYQLLLGAAELRALATGLGAELARLAQRSCLTTGGARDLLVSSDRWRSVTLAVPPAPQRDDPVLVGMLAAYRSATGSPSRQQHLEIQIRERVRQSSGRAGSAPNRPQWTVDLLLRLLGDDQLLQIVEIDGRLHHVLCGRGRVRRHTPDAAGDLAAEVLFARSALRRFAYGRAKDPSVLAIAGHRLATFLIGQTAQHLGDGALIIVPPAMLHGVPWALLEGLDQRVLSIAPSVSAWVRARQASAPPERVALVRGPGLAHGAEMDKLAGGYPQATVLHGDDATVARVLDALDGSSLAHVAAHGAVRSDNPLFSHLRLADGPMTVHDVARLRHAPHRLILPSCESAALTPAGSDELLGLAAALLPRGTAALVATADPVNDEATGALMLALHDALRGGATSLAEALLVARRSMPSDPVSRATAASFIAIGAG